jgi:hypothetical protein
MVQALCVHTSISLQYIGHFKSFVCMLFVCDVFHSHGVQP